MRGKGGMTPGPWAYTTHGDGYRVRAVQHGNPVVVATVHAMRPHDARAIAELPELIAAGRAMVTAAGEAEERAARRRLRDVLARATKE